MKVLSRTTYRNGLFSVDGKPHSQPTGDMDRDLSSAWASIELDLPRFVRMDRASKLVAIGTTPFFTTNGVLFDHQKDRIGMVVMGNSGSMDTDTRYFDQLVKDGHASPGLFVYTLPNIAMGELSIQHGLHGSGLCLLSEVPDLAQMREACELLVLDHGMRSVICGWSDIFADHAHATFVVVTPEKGSTWDHTELERIFNDH